MICHRSHSHPQIAQRCLPFARTVVSEEITIEYRECMVRGTALCSLWAPLRFQGHRTTFVPSISQCSCLQPPATLVVASPQHWLHAQVQWNFDSGGPSWRFPPHSPNGTWKSRCECSVQNWCNQWKMLLRGRSPLHILRQGIPAPRRWPHKWDWHYFC